MEASSCPSCFFPQKFQTSKKHKLSFQLSDSAALAKVLLRRHQTVIYGARWNSRTKLTKQHFIKSNKSPF